MTEAWDQNKLLDLSRSFQKCRILLSAAELGLFDILAEGKSTVEDICRQNGLHPRGLRILLDALASQGLANKTAQGEYFLDDYLSSLLSTRGEQSVLPMILHAVKMWQSWSHLADVVRTGENPDHVRLVERLPQDMEAFIGAMHVIGKKMAETIATSVDLTGFHRLLDIGGASGTYAMAFLKKAPHMRATIFDLPSVMAIAEDRLKREGFSNRIEFLSGDYHTDALPTGHDLVLLSAVIHINGRDANQSLFRKINRAIESGGALLIRDYFMDDARTFPPAGAVFAVNMLTSTRAGNSHTYEEVKKDLDFSGFIDIVMIRNNSNMDQLVIARKL